MLMTRPNDDSTTVAPCSCAIRAHANAIDASVSTPVTSTRFPARIPLTFLLEPGSAGTGDRHHRSVDVRRGVGCKPRDDSGNLFRARHPAERHVTQDLCTTFLGEHGCHVRLDEPWRNDVGGD